MHSTLFYRIKDIFTKTGAGWDQLAPSKDTAINYAHDKLNQDPERMIDAYKYSLEYCLAHSGESINERYRTGRTLDDVDSSIPDMINKYTTKQDIVVYRGVCDHVYELMIENAKMHPGTDLLEKGFLATSLVKGCELHYKKKLRIYVPAGTHAVYQGNVNDEQGFYEVDIQHEAHLKIISIDKEYINCKLLHTA